MQPKRRAAAIAVALLVCSGLACATLKPPEQLSPIGDTAWYAREVIKGVAGLQQAAIDAEKAGALSVEDARTVVDATKKAGQAGEVLATSLKAGLPQQEAKAKAIAVIREALGELPKHLSKSAGELVTPYIQLVLTLLTALD
jgi:hypothetical protein